jgi:hypothetical protein
MLDSYQYLLMVRRRFHAAPSPAAGPEGACKNTAATTGIDRPLPNPMDIDEAFSQSSDTQGLVLGELLSAVALTPRRSIRIAIDWSRRTQRTASNEAAGRRA